MNAASLALMWHQHQPYYPDDVSGENPMPWVRLHGTKDYIGMAMHIKEVPEFRCTINLVPSLLVQIRRYTEEGASDRHLDVSRASADSLSENDALYLLDHFFMANVDCMIRPYPRYYELYLRRGFGTDKADRALPRYSARDLRDLQVWSNLTWMHPLLFEEDPELAAFRDKGQGWSEDEKQWLLGYQRDVLARVIPLHRELSEGGQVELTTTPFYHPILPLLWNKRSAREAMTGCDLPAHLESYADDAKIHLERAVEFHTELFGAPPRGMWPSEGSVSQEIIQAIADVGIEWIATDEEILSHSTQGFVARDGQGHLSHPEMLYRPWHVEDGGKSLQIVFRDHGLSDLIGFHYQRNDPVWAADDMLGRVASIGQAVAGQNSGRPALVPVILDGENCWEYYRDGGVEFLRTLYRKAVEHKQISPVRIGDYLAEQPGRDRINRLFAGSWINHDFYIWIGHQEDRDAWDVLHETRQFLQQVERESPPPKETLEQAWREIFIAEGSDWFWWFGDDHSSDQDALFDELFRKHLRNVYTLTGHHPPASLQRPIMHVEKRVRHTMPRGFCSARVDGRATYFEWIDAGRYEVGSERGTMTQVSDGVVQDLWFGFDAETLMLRLDTRHVAADDLAGIDELCVRFLEPAGYEVRVTGFGGESLEAVTYLDGEPVSACTAQAAVDAVFECSVAFGELKIHSGAPVHLFVELFDGGQSTERVPSEGAIEFSVPSPDFEMYMWQA